MAIPYTWRAVFKGDTWIIETQDKKVIATLGKGKEAKANANAKVCNLSIASKT
jgi:hypothetical protein